MCAQGLSWYSVGMNPLLHAGLVDMVPPSIHASRIDKQGHICCIHLEPSFEAQQPHMACGHWTAQAEPEHSVVSPTEALTSKHFILVIQRF